MYRPKPCIIHYLQYIHLAPNMKKILATAVMASLILMGCNQSKNDTPTEINTAQPQAQTSNTASTDALQKQEIHFTGPYDLTITLQTNDNFETATMTDNSDKTYQLKRTISANGIRLENTDDGVMIHFKATDHGNEGFVELVKDKSIEIKEFKQ